jgi:hypothetical protein
MLAFVGFINCRGESRALGWLVLMEKVFACGAHSLHSPNIPGERVS